MTESSEKKRRVIKEDVKDRHTNHWDLDYVSRDELERLMAKEQSSSATASTLSKDTAEDALADKQNPVSKDQDQ